MNFLFFLPVLLDYYISSVLGLLGNIEYVDVKKPLPRVTIVTAVSESHASEARTLVDRLLKNHPDWKIYIWDIGLRKTSRQWFVVGYGNLPNKNNSENV